MSISPLDRYQSLSGKLAAAAAAAASELFITSSLVEDGCSCSNISDPSCAPTADMMPLSLLLAEPRSSLALIYVLLDAVAARGIFAWVLILVVLLLFPKR